MAPLWLFGLLVVVGLGGAWVMFLYCIWVSVQEFRSGQMLRSKK